MPCVIYSPWAGGFVYADAILRWEHSALRFIYSLCVCQGRSRTWIKGDREVTERMQGRDKCTNGTGICSRHWFVTAWVFVSICTGLCVHACIQKMLDWKKYEFCSLETSCQFSIRINRLQDFTYIYIYISTFDTSLIRFCPVTYHPVSVLSAHWWEQRTHLLCGYTPSSIFNFDIFQPSVFTERPMRSEREREWTRDWERQKARHQQQNEREGAALCSRISDDKQNYKCLSRVSAMLRIAYYHTTSTIFFSMQHVYFAQYARILCMEYLDDICQNVPRTTEQKLRGKLHCTRQCDE